MRTKCNRGGWSLVEVLVAIAICMLLLALVLPGIQQMREAARRASCQNNLRQLAMAATAYHGQNGSFPYTSAPTGTRVLGTYSGISPHCGLLPYLDQEELYQQINFAFDNPLDYSSTVPQSSTNPQLLQQAVPTFHCPTNPFRAGGNSYRGSFGTGIGLLKRHAKLPDCKEPKLTAGMFAHFRAIRDVDVRDGLSNTAIFSEKTPGDRRDEVFSWYGDVYYQWQVICSPGRAEIICGARSEYLGHDSYTGATWRFGGWRHTWYNHLLPPNSKYPDCIQIGPVLGGAPGAYTARSMHPGGVNLAYADGSVTFVADSVSTNIWTAWGSRAGQEVLVP